MLVDSDAPCLIVNADDYGYFRGVSAGIIEAAARGIVTATGVFANAPGFDDDLPALRECTALDVGVHLNLTDGRPLTPDMRKRLSRWQETFPGKYAVARAVLARAIPLNAVAVEWRAQIERCLDGGLTLRFLNSHEHVHMLPALFSLVQSLADQFAIPHVRFAEARGGRGAGGAAIVRSAILKVLAWADRTRARRPSARFLGLEASGRLDAQALDAATAGLRRGQVYELMCHPGRLDPAAAADARLLAYHDWEGELATLTDPRAKSLLAERGIRLIGYRQLAVRGDRLVAAPLQPQVSP